MVNLMNAIATQYVRAAAKRHLENSSTSSIGTSTPASRPRYGRRPGDAVRNTGPVMEIKMQNDIWLERGI